MAENQNIENSGTGNDFEIVVLNFADSKVPEFKESRNRDWILFGEDNMYPDYLVRLYDKSDRHNAIINSKSNYILGSGFKSSSNVVNGFVDIKNSKGEVAIPAMKINRDGETMYDVMKKSIKDIEIFGGFRWVVIYNRLGLIAEIYHEDFHKWRKAKDKPGYYWREDWSKEKDNKEDAIYYDEFDPNLMSDTFVQVFAYNEYRPKCKVYPLPGYLGCNNYIECDIEISKFHLSAIRNGLAPSKLIQFYTGEPTGEKKKQIEKRMKDKMGGSENAGKFILVFNTSKDKTVDIADLSASDLDKQFDVLNKTCEQHIITGHQIVSPMLFGVKTEGQLGGATELKVSYEVFINTYAKPKQYDIEKIVNYFGDIMGVGNDYSIQQLDPVGIVITDSLIEKVLQPDEIRERIGAPKIDKPVDSEAQKVLNALSSVSPLVATKVLDNLTQDEIRSLVNLNALPAGTPVSGGNPPTPTITAQQEAEQAAADGVIQVNDNIKNLNAKQHQQLLRVIRQYTKGQITQEQASLLLKVGLGLNDEEINTMLGVKEPQITFAQFSAELITEEAVAEMFSHVGDLKSDFHIVTSKRIKFNNEQDALKEEHAFFKEYYAGVEVTNAEANILDLIKKDNKITPEVIAKTIKSTPEYVTSKIASLVKRGILETSNISIGEDTEIERKVVEKIKTTEKPETVSIEIKYSYEVKPKVGAAIIETTRPFCKKLIELDRLYSRAEIEGISERLGYSVWDRKGGWWGDSPECRHQWVSHVVVKKGKKK